MSSQGGIPNLEKILVMYIVTGTIRQNMYD